MIENILHDLKMQFFYKIIRRFLADQNWIRNRCVEVTI